MTAECDPFGRDAAVYLLDALDEADRDAFEAHLAACAACRDRVAELRPTVAMLTLLPTEPEVEAGPVPDTLLPGLLRRAARERTRRRGAVVGLASVAAACLVALVVTLWPSATPDRVPTRALQPVASAPIAATAQFVSKPWGTQIDLECRYQRELRADVSYRLVVVDLEDNRHDAGSWKLGEGTTEFIGGTEVRRDRIAKVEITLPDGRAVMRLTL